MKSRVANFGVTVTDRMQIQIRTIVSGLLLAFSATAVRADPNAPDTAPPIAPAATQQSTPLDLGLSPAAAPQPDPLDLTMKPAATRQSIPLDLGSISAAAPQPGLPDLALPSASAEVKQLVRWVIDSGDNARLPFLLIDKVNARVFVFNPAGQLQGDAPALLGMARGDRLLAPNTATMEQMPPKVRITPAGRFVSRLAIDSLGKELLVLDYEASISLHAVVKGTRKERRAERLNSPTSQDNRISYGCINVPQTFYTSIVSPAFTRTKGIVYVLPETGPASALFGFNPADALASGTQQSPPAANVPTSQNASASHTAPAPAAN